MKILLLLLLFSSTLSKTVDDYEPGFFKPSEPSGFWNVDTGSKIEGKILSLGDINGDG